MLSLVLVCVKVDKPDLWVSGHSYEDAIKKAAEKLKVDRKFLELTQGKRNDDGTESKLVHAGHSCRSKV